MGRTLKSDHKTCKNGEIAKWKTKTEVLMFTCNVSISSALFVVGINPWTDIFTLYQLVCFVSHSDARVGGEARLL